MFGLGITTFGLANKFNIDLIGGRSVPSCILSLLTPYKYYLDMGK